MAGIDNDNANLSFHRGGVRFGRRRGRVNRRRNCFCNGFPLAKQIDKKDAVVLGRRYSNVGNVSGDIEKDLRLPVGIIE